MLTVASAEIDRGRGLTAVLAPNLGQHLDERPVTTDMQVEIAPLVRGFRHTILADQDEGRKEDGLEEAVVASPAKEGSNFGVPGSIPKTVSTHAP
jgi:hypothetical protein